MEDVEELVAVLVAEPLDTAVTLASTALENATSVVKAAGRPVALTHELGIGGNSAHEVDCAALYFVSFRMST